MKDFENIDIRLKTFAYIFLLSNKLQATMDKKMSGLTAKQWFLMATLSFMEGPTSLKDLADAMQSSHQNTRQIVNKLEKNGFVTISQNENDKRSILIEASDKINQWQEKTEAMQINFIEDFYKSLENERIQKLYESMKILFNNLGEMNEDN